MSYCFFKSFCVDNKLKILLLIAPRIVIIIKFLIQSYCECFIVENGEKNIKIDVMMIEHALLHLEDAEIDAIVLC
jgi:hypothetical protein